MDGLRKAIAIDFDGCLCTDAFPAIGEPNWPVIKRAQAEQRDGAGLILWTCREGNLLQEAVAACEGWGLTFNSINESLTDWIEAFKTQPRKVGATEYWDDKAVRIPDTLLPNAPLAQRTLDIESHSEAEILKGCIALMQELMGCFEEYLDYMGIKPESNEERFCVNFTHFHIVQRLFLWRTYHSGGTSTIEKCKELGLDSGDTVAFEDDRETRENA